jgi:hypothetical protein
MFLEIRRYWPFPLILSQGTPLSEIVRCKKDLAPTPN